MPNYCPACRHSVQGFLPGPGGRPNARCPHCQSLERHRFLALLLENLAPMIIDARAVLDVAPMRQVGLVLRRLSRERYVSIDLDPAADGRSVIAQADMTALPFADASIDFALCYHVFEHVPDDKTAMQELRRVLSDRGFALVQVPWRRGRDTDEDPSAPVEERVRRFGQADHVRWYGADFDARLQAAGLQPLRFTPVDMLSADTIRAFGLLPDESVWVVRRAQVAGWPPELADVGDLLRLHTLEEFRLAWGQAAELRREAAVLREEAARWQRNYERLRGRWPVRVLAAARRALRFR